MTKHDLRAKKSEHVFREFIGVENVLGRKFTGFRSQRVVDSGAQSEWTRIS
jgi:hypothetical protein